MSNDRNSLKAGLFMIVSVGLILFVIVGIKGVGRLTDPADMRTVRFKLNTPDAEIWLDGGRLGTGSEVAAEVPAGRHRVLVRLDPRKLPEGLRLEGEGASFVTN